MEFNSVICFDPINTHDPSILCDRDLCSICLEVAMIFSIQQTNERIIMWKDEIKKEWNDNPLKVIAIGAFVATAASKVLNAVSAAQGRRAYAKQINYKVRR